MGEKTEQTATVLDLTLTGRNVGLDERIPMCGFPYHVAVNPEDKYSGFETAEEYLSGRVVDKLQTAERMKQSNPDLIDYDKNISALREVQLSPVKASDIAVGVGTSWIDKERYKEFFCELIGMPYYYRDGVELYYNKHDGSWRIDRPRRSARKLQGAGGVLYRRNSKKSSVEIR